MYWQLLKKLNQICWALLFFIYALSLVAAAAELTVEQDSRYQKLTSELRCIVCQNNSLAESQAPLAVDLRRKIKQQIENNQTDEQIIAYMAERYGDYILYRPPFNYRTAVLWLAPFFLLLYLIYAALKHIYRHNKVQGLADNDLTDSEVETPHKGQ